MNTHKGEAPYCDSADRRRKEKEGDLCLREDYITAAVDGDTKGSEDTEFVDILALVCPDRRIAGESPCVVRGTRAVTNARSAGVSEVLNVCR